MGPHKRSAGGVPILKVTTVGVIASYKILKISHIARFDERMRPTAKKYNIRILILWKLYLIPSF
jgi:hypothetical protein